MIDAGKYFFRDGVCCMMTENDGGIWWGHVGLPPGHQHFGKGFIFLRPVSVSRLAIPPMLSGDTMGSKWWMGFEGGYSQERTFEHLKRVVEQLNEEHDE